MFFIINEQVIYEQDFPDVLWPDNSGGNSVVYYVDGSFLRSGSSWTGYVPRFVTVHVADFQRVAARNDAKHGLHQRFLERLVEIANSRTRY